MICTPDQKEAIYRDYADKVFGYVLHKINDHHIAEDIRSDVFLKVYEKLDSFDETKSSLSTWIYTITRNTLIDYFRTRRIGEEIPEDLRSDDNTEDIICRSEMLEELASALSAMGTPERDVILLHYYQGMTFKELAPRMGYSYSYIKYLHNKALNELRKNSKLKND